MTSSDPPHAPVEIIGHLVSRYHERHRVQLPALVELAVKVERVHGDDPHVPRGLADLLCQLSDELEVHMKKEELILFPAMSKGGMPGIDRPIAVMRADHQDHADSMAEIRRLTGGPKLPEGACCSWTALYDGLAEFLDDLSEHSRIENDVLFPLFEAS